MDAVCSKAEKYKMVECVRLTSEEACAATTFCRWCSSDEQGAQCSFAGSDCTYDCNGSHLDTIVRATPEFHTNACPTSSSAGCAFAARSDDLDSLLTVAVVGLLYLACYAWCYQIKRLPLVL